MRVTKGLTGLGGEKQIQARKKKEEHDARRGNYLHLYFEQTPFRGESWADGLVGGDALLNKVEGE